MDNLSLKQLTSYSACLTSSI